MEMQAAQRAGTRLFRIAAPIAALAGCSGSTQVAGSGDGAAQVAVDPPAAPGAMAANLAPARDGSAIMTWIEPAGSGEHRLRFSRFARGAWSDPVTVTEGPALVASSADLPSAAEAAGGVVVAHWSERRRGGEHAQDVVLARSADGGATWRRLGPAHTDGTDTEHGFATLLGQADGRVRAFWLDGRDTARKGGAMTLRTALVGERIEESALLDDRVCDCCSTSAATTPDGPLLAYRDRSGEEVRDISIVRHGDAAWSRPLDVHRDGWRIAACPVNGPAAAATGRDVAVAWYTYAGQRHGLRAAFSQDGGASFAAAIEVDGPVGQRAPLGRVAIAMERSGEALVGWVASRPGGGEILIRRVARDGRLGPERIAARTRSARETGVPRMVTVAGEQLLLAWTEPGARLRAALLPLRAVAPVGESGGRAVASASPQEGPVSGEDAPVYAARSLAGRRVDLAGLRGKVVLLNLWATWCAPCRRELPDLAELHRRRAREGLAIVAVSLDGADERDEVAAFVKERDLPFAIWLDPESRASELFGVRTLPTTLLLGRDGVIRWRRDSIVSMDDPDFRRALDAALGER